jgi:hypothetical protein
MLTCHSSPLSLSLTVVRPGPVGPNDLNGSALSECFSRDLNVEAYCICVETTHRRPFTWRLVIVQSGSTVQDRARLHRRGGRQLFLSLVNCVGPEKQRFWTLPVCFVHGSHFPHRILFFFHASQRYIHQQKVRYPL